VSKTARTVPNERLRRERLRRGWSREYVARQICLADPKTLGRWERGVSSPSSYFLQRLCALFSMPAQDLGLFYETYSDCAEAAHMPAPTYQHTMTLPGMTSVYDQAMPPSPGEAGGLIGRDALLSGLKLRLNAGKHTALSALHGLPGVGKTSLAVALAHDAAIQQHFSDGILWVGLGPQPNVPGQLGRWGTLLGIPQASMATAMSEEALATVVHTTIGTRRMLVVIDDAWTIEDALAFKVGGPNCAYLLTTRVPAVALHFANDGATCVQELCDQDGLQLLARFAPGILTHEPEAAHALVQSVGGLPLALTLAGRYLQSQTHCDQPRRLRAGLERLHHPIERLRLTAPQGSLERHTSLPAGTPLSLQAVIEASDWLLDDAARQTLYALSAFPAKPHSFSEEAALAVSASSLEKIDELVDAGLLQTAGPGRYTLHQTIADYASSKRCGETMTFYTSSSRTYSL
jgi:DNA-binding XRE family transcriptional regulator